MGAIIPLIIQYLPYLVAAAKVAPQITTFIAGLHDILKRDKSWTPEQEAEFDAQTEALRSDPYWQVTDTDATGLN
jgi:hypothetical protein